MNEIDQLLRSVVPEVTDVEFDSHDVIRRLAHHHQRQYVALLSASPSDTPFQDVHGRIGKRLKALAAELGLSEGVASASHDVFGQVGACVAYQRLPPSRPGRDHGQGSTSNPTNSTHSPRVLLQIIARAAENKAFDINLSEDTSGNWSVDYQGIGGRLLASEPVSAAEAIEVADATTSLHRFPDVSARLQRLPREVGTYAPGNRRIAITLYPATPPPLGNLAIPGSMRDQLTR
jgi:hypothetical protein